ncbi:MAG TPA: hypothetical protein VI485_24570 [Vicinamibacterales bacterium]|nr:hypothetical protein [Vicinamibacterales bacterium]
MTWKLYALVSGGGLLATYLMSSPTIVPGRAVPAAAAPQRAVRQTQDEIDIQELAARLQARVRAEAEYREPGRDPFRFVARQPARQVNSPKPHVIEASVPFVAAPVLPSIALSGIATDQIDGVSQRTAVLSTPAGILIVREGESVAGLYRVVTIEDEAVELEASDGTRRTLRFSGR